MKKLFIIFGALLLICCIGGCVYYIKNIDNTIDIRFYAIDTPTFKKLYLQACGDEDNCNNQLKLTSENYNDLRLLEIELKSVSSDIFDNGRVFNRYVAYKDVILKENTSIINFFDLSESEINNCTENTFEADKKFYNDMKKFIELDFTANAICVNAI